MTILIIAVSAVVLLNIVSFIINKTVFSDELDNISPYGQLVDVNGGKMHVFSMGNGEKTIVLLPGFGVPLPSADFGPLMRALSEEYTVVCVEYFGVGFSDETKTPRTNENYTEEIRKALSLAGFAAPYVLMPHSGSGIYSEYYAAKYPEEVSEIIMLDTTSSAKPQADVPKFVLGIGKVQQDIGLSRLFNSKVVSSILKINTDNGYNKNEVDDYTKFMNHVNNDTIIDQTYRLNENILEVMETDFPESIPVLKIAATETIKKTGEEYQTEHINRLGSQAKLISVNSTHYIYHDDVKAIIDAANDFLQNK